MVDSKNGDKKKNCQYSLCNMMIKKYVNFDLTNDKWQTTMTQDKKNDKGPKNNDARLRKYL